MKRIDTRKIPIKWRIDNILISKCSQCSHSRLEYSAYNSGMPVERCYNEHFEQWADKHEDYPCCYDAWETCPLPLASPKPEIEEDKDEN